MSQAHKSHRVFVVDDESVIAWSLELILRQMGFEATSFTDPLQALQAARVDAPDLLISDVIMPDLSGIELAILVQERCPECKVLLFSGQPATAESLERARVRGYFFDVLPKPVHPAELLAKIQDVIQCGTLLHSARGSAQGSRSLFQRD